MKIKCLECDKEFIPKGKNQFGTQKYCCKKCKDRFYKKKIKKERQEKKKNSGNKQQQAVTKNKNNQDQIEIKQSFNGLGTDLKAIEKYQKLSEEVCILMRKNRIEKYGINTQNIILELMEACSKHLNNQLDNKEVIMVDWE